MSEKPKTSQLADSYHRMLERVKRFIEEAEDEFTPKISYAIEAAKKQASELGELTREEADKIGEYLQRDLHDAAEYLEEEGTELKDWLKFDIDLIEDRLLDTLSHAVNSTSLELQQLSERARQENLWYVGEVTGPGTFVCTRCGHELTFYHIQDIPVCPECGEGVFKRTSAEQG